MMRKYAVHTFAADSVQDAYDVPDGRHVHWTAAATGAVHGSFDTK